MSSPQCRLWSWWWRVSLLLRRRIDFLPAEWRLPLSRLAATGSKHLQSLSLRNRTPRQRTEPQVAIHRRNSAKPPREGKLRGAAAAFRGGRRPGLHFAGQ
jgi:hypothetical protein